MNVSNVGTSKSEEKRSSNFGEIYRSAKSRSVERAFVSHGATDLENHETSLHLTHFPAHSPNNLLRGQ